VTIKNAMTIDVEDYFQVSAFENHIDKSTWDTIPCRLENNMDRILQLLSDHDTRATFFTLGWVADNYPSVIKKIVSEGHELASHGYQHIRVSDQTSEQFLADISRTKDIIATQRRSVTKLKGIELLVSQWAKKHRGHTTC